MEFCHAPVPLQPQTAVDTDTRLRPLHCLLHRGAHQGLTPSQSLRSYGLCYLLMVAAGGSAIFLDGVGTGRLVEKERGRGGGGESTPERAEEGRVTWKREAYPEPD